MSVIPLAYTATWEYINRDEIGSVLDGTRRWACMLTGADNIDGRMSDMERMGYHVHSVVIHARCATCNGSGRMQDQRMKRTMRWKTCKACKGAPDVWSRHAERGDDLRNETP